MPLIEIHYIAREKNITHVFLVYFQLKYIIFTGLVSTKIDEGEKKRRKTKEEEKEKEKYLNVKALIVLGIHMRTVSWSSRALVSRPRSSSENRRILARTKRDRCRGCRQR